MTSARILRMAMSLYAASVVEAQATALCLNDCLSPGDCLVPPQPANR